MNHIESAQRKLERIGLMKLERVSRLRLDIDADHIEACTVIANSGAPCAAKKV